MSDRIEALVDAANVGNVVRVRVIGLLGDGGLLNAARLMSMRVCEESDKRNTWLVSAYIE